MAWSVLGISGKSLAHSDIIHQKRITTKSWGQISSNNFDGLPIPEYIIDWLSSGCDLRIYSARVGHWTHIKRDCMREVSACKSLHVWMIPTIKFAGDIKKGHRSTFPFFAPWCNFRHKNGLMRWKMWKNPSLSKGDMHLNTCWPLSPHSQGKTLMQWQPQLVMNFSYWEMWLIFSTSPDLLALPCTISIIHPKSTRQIETVTAHFTYH